MKKLICLALAICVVLSLGTFAQASEGGDLSIIVNDQVINLTTPVQVHNETTYVPYLSVVKALYPSATAVWENGQAVVTAPGLTMELPVGKPYLVANGRYLYMPQGYRSSNNVILVPVRILCAALGANVAWDPVGNAVVITAGTGPITPAETAYNADDLYWLSHIINAESGNQPLTGKIGVGNVVLNRVASSTFPNSVYSVIFQKNQFSPVASGTINKEPNDESVIAAKLCLDGANTVGNALFFLNPKVSPNCWATRNRPYLMTIGGHAFYG